MERGDRALGEVRHRGTEAPGAGLAREGARNGGRRDLDDPLSGERGEAARIGRGVGGAEEGGFDRGGDGGVGRLRHVSSERAAKRIGEPSEETTGDDLARPRVRCPSERREIDGEGCERVGDFARGEEERPRGLARELGRRGVALGAELGLAARGASLDLDGAPRDLEQPRRHLAQATPLGTVEQQLGLSHHAKIEDAEEPRDPRRLVVHASEAGGEALLRRHPRHGRERVAGDRGGLALDVLAKRRSLAVRHAIDLVHDHEQARPCVTRPPHRVALGRLPRLPRVEEEEHHVRLAEPLVGDLAVEAVLGVVPRRVDELDRAEERVRQPDRDARDGLAGEIDLSQGGAQIARRDDAIAALLERDPGEGLFGEDDVVEHRRGRQDAHGRDLRAEEGVDEGALPRVELAHHGQPGEPPRALGEALLGDERVWIVHGARGTADEATDGGAILDRVVGQDRSHPRRAQLLGPGARPRGLERGEREGGIALGETRRDRALCGEGLARKARERRDEKRRVLGQHRRADQLACGVEITAVRGACERGRRATELATGRRRRGLEDRIVEEPGAVENGDEPPALGVAHLPETLREPSPGEGRVEERRADEERRRPSGAGEPEREGGEGVGHLALGHRRELLGRGVFPPRQRLGERP